MNCECNNNSNRVKPRIKHVYGNVLRMAIPLTLRTLVKDDDEMIVNDTDFIPSSDHLVRVVFSKGKTNYPITATMDGNVAIIEDKGKIPVGTYDISVECYDDLGNPYRFKQNAVLYVADTTAEAGIDEEIEYEAQTWYLNAAVFLATTEIGEIGDVIDAKLDDVFGNVMYDANAKEIRFYNKGNSRVLATIDSRPFVVDGTVADVYIDVSRQVLVVVLNEDAGGRRFSVPLYLVFNSYYKKDEVDSLVSRTVEGVRFDFLQDLPLVVPVTKNGSSISSSLDFGSIDNAIHEDGRLVVACVNNGKFYQLLNANSMEIVFSHVTALDGYQELLIVDESNVWSMEDVDLGTGGGAGYEPPAGGIPKSDLAQSVQDTLDDVDNKVDKETGKGLSTNDYTTAEKTKLAELENYDDSALQTAIDGKVDKESGKSLMTDAERTKLAGIAAGAEVNVQSDWTQTTTTADDYIKNKPTIPDVSGFATTTAMNQAIEDKLTEVSVAAISETDAKFFIRDGALCISTENFVVVTTVPSISKVVNSDGTATITITHSNNSAIIEYSLDGGTTWQTYSTALTINTAGTHTIKARAQVSGSPMSDIVTDTVTLVSSAMPTLSVSKTSSDVTLTASGNGTVVMTVDGTVQTSPYTVNRGSDSQTLAVVVTNKEANKLIATLTQSVVVPKVTVISQKIQDFCTRVTNDGGSLIWGDAETTQEKYDEHTLLLGAEPELDFLGYKGTKSAPTYLYSVNENCDANSLSAVYINDDGLIVASESKVGRGTANIKWTKYTGTYSTRFAPDITYNGDSRTVNRDFKKLYMSAANGFLDCDGTTTEPYYKNGLFSGFPNRNGQWGCVGNQDGVLELAREQTTVLAKYVSTGMTTLHIDRSSATMVVTINGSAATVSDAADYICGSRTNIAHAYMQMKANSPLLVLAY